MSDKLDDKTDEQNRLSKRLGRYAQVGANVGGIAAKFAGQRIFGYALNDSKNASDLAKALGGLKGPIMKVAQLLSTIPDAVPPEYAEELSKLQNQAPAMGWVFVKRRMAAELGSDWMQKFGSFEREAAASASLGQVHKAIHLDGQDLACKLQYPEMDSAVEADLNQLKILLSVYNRLDKALDTSQILPEISERLREELDYFREAKHAEMYHKIFEHEDRIRVPQIYSDLSSKRLLTMQWLYGKSLFEYSDASQENRNKIAAAMFKAWWHPFSHYGVIHGDPHPGNYTVFEDEMSGDPLGINLIDYGCIRIFPPKFVQGVIDLYRGLQTDNRDLTVHAYETWGFHNLSDELIEILNIWAHFIYGPLLDDRVRTIAEDIKPSEYGRREAFAVHQGLKDKGPVKIPREFIFMDRAAIGLGSVFIRLKAKMNFYQLFNETIEGFDLDKVSKIQDDILKACDIPRN